MPRQRRFVRGSKLLHGEGSGYDIHELEVTGELVFHEFECVVVAVPAASTLDDLCFCSGSERLVDDTVLVDDDIEGDSVLFHASAFVPMGASIWGMGDLIRR